MNSNQKNFYEVIGKNTIDLGMEVNTKEEAIRHLADLLLKDQRIIDKEVLLEDIFERENIETTNMGMGVAIPHGKSSTVMKNSIAIGRLSEPISWDSKEDSNPISAIFLLAVGDDAQRDKAHLELISKVATLLVNKNFLTQLFKTDSKADLIKNMYTLVGEK